MGHAAAALCPPCGLAPCPPKLPSTTSAAPHRPSSPLRPSSGLLSPLPTSTSAQPDCSPLSLTDTSGAHSPPWKSGAGADPQAGRTPPRRGHTLLGCPGPGSRGTGAEGWRSSEGSRHHRPGRQPLSLVGGQVQEWGAMGMGPSLKHPKLPPGSCISTWYRVRLKSSGPEPQGIHA